MKLRQLLAAPSNTGGTSGSLSVKALWLAAAKTLGFAFNVALPLFLVRELSVSEFGVYKQVFLVVETAMLVLPLGFVMSAFYFWPREPARREAVVFNILLFYLFTTGVAFLVLAGQPDILARIFHGTELVPYGPAIGLVIFLWGASSPFLLEMIVIANGETRLAAALIVTLQLTKVILFLGAALWSPSIDALILAAALQGALQVGIAFLYLRSRFGRFWQKFDPALMRAQLTYSLPHGFAGLLVWIQTDLHNYFVAHRFDAATYAIYAAGCFQLPFLGILSGSAGTVAIPRVTELEKDGRRSEILEVIAGLMRKLAVVCFPLCALLLVARREFISVLYTEAYIAAAPLFALRLALVPLGVVATASDVVIRAYAKHRFFLVKLRLAVAALTVGGLWVGTVRFGLLGAVGAVVIVTLIDRLLVALKVGAILGVKRGELVLFKDLAKLAAASVLAGLVSALARNLLVAAGPAVTLLGCTLAFGGAYLLLVLLWQVPRREEYEAVRKQAARIFRLVAKKPVPSCESKTSFSRL